MPTLNPPHIELGLMSPAVGPWFGRSDGAPVNFELAEPDEQLSVEVSSSTPLVWFPPATGLLSVFIATRPRPQALASLRRPDGQQAFTDGHFVALFRLLPEVEDRLDQLSAAIPSADGDPNFLGRPTRARVRSFALELDIANPSLEDIELLLDPQLLDPGSPASRAQSVGLVISGAGLDNGPSPMVDLKRPGTIVIPSSGAFNDRLLVFGTQVNNARLWVFDSLGRAIDPGAVAAWWHFLAETVFEDTLWADLDPFRHLTANFTSRRTVHVVNAHEGPLTAPLLERVTANGAPLPASTLVLQADTSTPLTFSIPAVFPQDDPTPIPAVALLPNGQYGPTVNLWPSGFPIERDFVRVAAVDIERHLVGQPRVANPGDGPAAQRRAADQERTSTRVRCERTLSPVLLGTTDEAADAAIDALSGDGTAAIVASVLDRDWGGLDPLSAVTPSLPAVAPPDEDAVGDPAAISLIGGPSVLLEFELPSELIGAWVRAWPQALDTETARHVRLDGGSGRVRASAGGGRVSLVMTLAEGSAAPQALMGVDLIIVTANGSRFYADRRFARPAEVPGPAVQFAAVTGEVLVCETGFVGTSPNDVVGRVPSGVTLIALGDQSALIDQASIPANTFTSDVLIRQVGPGDAIAITRPAFANSPNGDSADLLQATGATVIANERAGLDRPLEPSAPIPTQERFEVAVARVGLADAAAAVASTPALSRFHEFIPHQAGHPGAPAALDVHGTGARLTARAAVAVAEYVRDRVNPNSADLALAANSPFANVQQPPGPTAWAAPLRTVAAGIEGEALLLQAFADASDLYPLGAQLETALDWLRNNLPGFAIPPATLAQAESIVRALDRRILAAARGAQEAAVSLRAAFNRAEDLVYIETPSLDTLQFGPTGAEADVMSPLIDLLARMDVRASLAVIICVPVHPLPGAPKGFTRVRDGLLLEIRDAFLAKGAHRVVLFSPSAGPGRTLRLASTTVIVDDCYALTGTTHLSRRGLSFDSSLAVSVFDERLEAGRPAEIRSFRRRLIGDRLGMPLSLVPHHPLDIVAAINRLSRHPVDLVSASRLPQPSSSRLALAAVQPPLLPVTNVDRSAWNRDGATPPSDFDLLAWIVALTPEIRAEVADSVTPPP